MHARRTLVLAFAIALLGWSARSGEPTPWPFGVAPSSSEVRKLVEDALALARRSRFHEGSAALARKEEMESTHVDQSMLDASRYANNGIFQLGDELFEHTFRVDSGLGGIVPGPRLRRVHTGVSGALDTFSCSGCHSVGGPDGAGSFAQNAALFGDGVRASSAMMRNPPAVIGLGFVQALGVEMSTELARARDRAIAEAKKKRADVEIELSAKQISFGRLTARPDGSVDTSKVAGVSSDLVVRPFGWKGEVALLRRQIEEAARIHFGVQSHVLALQYRARPDRERLGEGPSWWDPDGDGVQRELEEGSLSATAAYLAMVEIPAIIPPGDPALMERWANGDRLFDRIGCASCHARQLHLDDPIWRERADTTSGTIVVSLLEDGEAPRGSDQVRLFSDLKRHDMGEGLAEPRDAPSGVGRREWITRPLWGLAESAPYLHDGRAPTIPEAIALHGGEGEPAREAFERLDRDARADLHVFLLSLTRQPKVRIAK